MIKKVYPIAVSYIEYMKTWERKGGIIAHGLGDWGRGIAFGNLQANIETAVYHKCLKCLEMMALELGQAEDAQKYSQWAKRVYNTYNEQLLVTDDPQHSRSYYTSLDNYPRRDCDAIAQAIALQFELVPAEHISDVQQSFLEDVSDGKIRAGEIGLRYLFNTLGDLQRPDIVMQMARQEEHPSYMRFLRRGETTLLEFWQDDCRSKCHDMLGTIYEWFYAAILGVKPIGDAYKTFSFKPPYESEFNDVRGNVDSPYGDIAVHFQRTGNGTFDLSLTVPMGTTAISHLPKSHKGVSFERKGGTSRAVDASQSSLELSHGTYHIIVN